MCRLAPKALLLDLDDTLLDGSYLAPSIRMTCAALAEMDPLLNVQQLVEANAEAWQEYWPGIEEAWTLGELASDVVRCEIWGRTLRRCGCLDGSLPMIAAQTHARAERESFSLFEDAVQLLAEGFRGLPIGLVTNGASDIQREKLRTLGIEDSFSVIVVSGEIGRKKPDPAVFDAALVALGVEAATTWHVGDNLISDVAGASGAGLTAIWLNRQGRQRDRGSPEPTFEIRSLRELGSLGVDD